MRTLLLASLLMVVGCSKRSEEAKPATGSGSAVAAADPTAALPAVTEAPLPPGGTVSGIDLSALGSKMQYQKAHRGVGPSTDQVFAAVAKAGFKLDDRMQVLADVAAANYCEGGHIAKLTLVVCEYNAEKDAIAAKAALEQRWKPIQSTLEREVHGAAIITVVHGGDKTDVAKILAAANAA
jgi:hypothetical protein